MLQRWQSIEGVHFFNGTYFSFHYFVALYAFDSSPYCFHYYQTSISFPSSSEISASVSLFHSSILFMGRHFYSSTSTAQYWNDNSCSSFLLFSIIQSDECNARFPVVKYIVFHILRCVGEPSNEDARGSVAILLLKKSKHRQLAIVPAFS